MLKVTQGFSPVSSTFRYICVATQGNADKILSLNMQTYMWWKSLRCIRDASYETTSIPLCTLSEFKWEGTAQGERAH